MLGIFWSGLRLEGGWNSGSTILNGIILSSDQVSLEDFFQAPVITYDWKVTRKDPQLVKFGLMWKLYDEVALL